MKKIKERIKTFYYHWLARRGKVPVVVKTDRLSNPEVRFAWTLEYKDKPYNFTMLLVEPKEYVRAMGRSFVPKDCPLEDRCEQ